MPEKVYHDVHVGDPFKLARPCCDHQPGDRGVVTMKCRDGLKPSRLLARVRFDGERAEHLVDFPTSALDFLEGDELAEVIFARL